jgi:alkyl hydroperoxide reductase subunit AhpF
MIRDLFNRIKVVQLFPPVAAVTDNTAQVSAIIDRQGFESLVYVLEFGTQSDADAVFSVKIEEGDNSALSDAANVAAAQLQADTATGAVLDATPAALHQFAADFSNDNVSVKIGYLGGKRYTRVTLTPANNTGNFFLAGSAILSNARHNPAGATQVP